MEEREPSPPYEASPPTTIIDVMNVIGSRPDGWWRDRQGAIRRLVDQLVALDGALGPLVAVLDGLERPEYPAGEREGAVRVVYGRRRGRDSADDRIVELVEDHPRPELVTVVTSDRALAERCRRRGAAVRGVRSLLDHLR